MVATLLETFSVTPDEIASLTDRQIHNLYFHPRDNKGHIKWPEEALEADETIATFEEELMAMDMLRSKFRMPQKQYDVLVNKLRAKYGMPPIESSAQEGG